MGESASKLLADIQAQHAAIPWPQIGGLRNVLAHDYPMRVRH